MVLPLRVTESTRYATVYIVTSFPPFRRHFLKKHELCNDYKAVVSAIELTRTVCTQGPGAHFCAQAQGLDLVLGHRHRARILAWVCLKKECVHISTQRVPYSGSVSGHQVWRLPYFSACNKGNRTQSLPTRRLFVPLMSNFRFLCVGIKTEAFWYTVYVDIQTSSRLSILSYHCNLWFVKKNDVFVGGTNS